MDEPKDTRTPEQIAEDERRMNRAEELRKKSAPSAEEKSPEPTTHHARRRSTK
jgi:hypothetical protein